MAARPIKTAQGTWRIQIEVRGARDSGTFPTKREAEAWAITRRAELLASADGRGGQVFTLRQALLKYAREISPTKRGVRAEQIRLTAFESHPLPLDRPLASVTTAELVQWRDARLAVNARGSVLRDMTLLGGVFELARREWQWIPVNPMRDVRRPAEPDHRTRVISGREVRAMLRAMGHARHVRTVSQAAAYAFLLALFTGMRAGEVCALRWPDVAADHVRLHTSKTGHGRDVPLTAGAQAVIARMRGWDAESVFALTPQTLDSLFRRYRARAGLAGVTFHEARHTAATRLAGRLHVLELCKVFGWRSTTQALTYYNPDASAIARRLAAGAPSA